MTGQLLLVGLAWPGGLLALFLPVQLLISWSRGEEAGTATARGSWRVMRWWVGLGVLPWLFGLPWLFATVAFAMGEPARGVTAIAATTVLFAATGYLAVRGRQHRRALVVVPALAAAFAVSLYFTVGVSREIDLERFLLGELLFTDLDLVNVVTGLPWVPVVAYLTPMWRLFSAEKFSDQWRNHRDPRPAVAAAPNHGPRPLEYWYAFVIHDDEPTGKERPVLVLSATDGTVWFLKVSSQDKAGRRGWCRIDNSRWERPGDKESWLELARVHHEPRSVFRRRLGRESDPALLRELERLHPGHLGAWPDGGHDPAAAVTT